MVHSLKGCCNQALPVCNNYRMCRQLQLIQHDLLDYATALKQQELLSHQVMAQQRGFLMLQQHPPTVTLGRRAQMTAGLRDVLTNRGIAIYPIQRGGLATYHGPGQLVAYPILPLRAWGLRLKDYVTALESSMAMVCRQYGLNTTVGSQTGAPIGTWVNGQKVGAIGIGVQHGISRHGLAFNIDMDLTPFSLIQPCGLLSSQISSLAQQLRLQNRPCPALPAVQTALVEALQHNLGIDGWVSA